MMKLLTLRRRIVTLVLFSLLPAVYAQAFEESHLAVADEIIENLDLKNVMFQAMETGMKPVVDHLRQQGLSEARLGKVKQAYRNLINNVASDPDLMGRIRELYCQTFTEAELKELLRFYKTPLGQKSIEVLPQLYDQGAEIGREVAMKYTDQFEAELDEILSAAEDAPAEPETQD